MLLTLNADVSEIARHVDLRPLDPGPTQGLFCAERVEVRVC